MISTAESTLQWGVQRVASLPSDSNEVPRDWSEERKNEFTAGRRAASQALRLLHVSNERVERGLQGEPVWPGGVVGSISHSDSLAVACVGRTSGFASLGVDLERSDSSRKLPRGLFVESELKWISSFAPRDRPSLELLIVSSKEAAGKCIFYLEKVFPRWRSLSVEMYQDGQLTAFWNERADLRLRGRFSQFLGHWCTVVSHVSAN